MCGKEFEYGVYRKVYSGECIRKDICVGEFIGERGCEGMC